MSNDSLDHILAWGDDGLYKLNSIFTDSILIAPKPHSHMIRNPVLNPNESYYMVGGTIYDIKNARFIVLDTIVTKYFPDSCVICFPDYSFTAIPDEAMFTFDCGNAVSPDKVESNYSVCTYNCATGAFNIINKMINKDMCLHPAITADGSKIALFSHSNAYILYREWKE